MYVILESTNSNLPGKKEVQSVNILQFSHFVICLIFLLKNSSISIISLECYFYFLSVAILTFHDLLNFALIKNPQFQQFLLNVFPSLFQPVPPSIENTRILCDETAIVTEQRFVPFHVNLLLLHFSLGKNVTKAFYQANCTKRRQLKSFQLTKNFSKRKPHSFQQ